MYVSPKSPWSKLERKNGNLKEWEKSPMPYFLHTMITVYSKDKMPNLSDEVFRSYIIPKTMSLDSNMPKKGSYNLLYNLSTNTLMWIHLVESADLLTQTAIKQLPECLLSHKL